MNEAQLIAWIDQDDARVRADVRAYGVHLVYVGGGQCSAPGCRCQPDDEPPFGYTVGLFGLGHPELLIVGADTKTTSLVLNELFDRIRAGADLLPGELVTIPGWPHRIVVTQIRNGADFVLEANRFYQRPDEASVPVYELLFDDGDARLPGTPGGDAVG